MNKYMLKKLTKKQQGFAKDYLETGNASLAVKKNYAIKNDATARSIGSENLTKPNIRAFLDNKAESAVATIYQLSQKAKNEGVRLNASKDILDRAGYSATKTKISEDGKKPQVITLAWIDDREKPDKIG